jgi:hypothetical protein
LNRKVSRLRAFEDAVDVDGDICQFSAEQLLVIFRK